MAFSDDDLKKLENGYWFKRVPIIEKEKLPPKIIIGEVSLPDVPSFGTPPAVKR